MMSVSCTFDFHTLLRFLKTKLLLVNMGFFMCHIYWSETEQPSVLYTDALFISQTIGRKMTSLLVDIICFVEKPIFLNLP